MSDTSKCAWKLVDPDKFVLGQTADRCGEQAMVKILRPFRKTDLFLCECHLNEFISTWGLHNSVEVLPCPEPVLPQEHPVDYDECDCIGTWEHAMVMGWR